METCAKVSHSQFCWEIKLNILINTNLQQLTISKNIFTNQKLTIKIIPKLTKVSL